ncbi:MAG: N-(5'-phosphoribosyl)anthranilate isomerase [Acidobacteriota bacterium]
MIFRVKVCGITQAEGLQEAVAAGADAVGFNFHPPSPRFVPPEVVSGLVKGLPRQVVTVGVFVNLGLDHVVEWMDRSGVTWAQFHGDQQPSDLAGFPRPWYPVLRPPRDEGSRVEAWERAPCILVDAREPERYGGTGRTANWKTAARLARQRPVILAGGLHSGNLEAALEAVHPAAVDLNSGVESAPGIKDPVKLRQAMRILAPWRKRFEEEVRT